MSNNLFSLAIHIVINRQQNIFETETKSGVCVRLGAPELVAAPCGKCICFSAISVKH